MSLGSFLLDSGMLPFTGALMFVAGLLIIELIMSLMGASLMGDGAGDTDFDLDAGADGFDAADSLDAADGMDAADIADLDGVEGLEGTDIDAAGTAGAPSGIAAWLGFGEVPFVLWAGRGADGVRTGRIRGAKRGLGPDGRPAALGAGRTYCGDPGPCGWAAGSRAPWGGWCRRPKARPSHGGRWVTGAGSSRKAPHGAAARHRPACATVTATGITSGLNRSTTVSRSRVAPRC